MQKYFIKSIVRYELFLIYLRINFYFVVYLL